MPIGLALGGAAIGAGASIIGANKAAKAQTKAAESAADTSLQVAQLNNDLFKQIYGQNYGVLAPYANMGLGPGTLLNDLLLGTNNYRPNMSIPATPAFGMPGPAAPATGAPATSAAPITVPASNGVARVPAASALSAFAMPGRAVTIGGDPDIYAYGGGEMLQPSAGGTRAAQAYFARQPTATRPALGAPTTPMTPPAGTVTTPAPAPATGGSTAPTGALDAFARFRQGTNYQWRLGESLDALQSGFAARGALDSGAANRSAMDLAGNMASAELGTFMDRLASQQGLGLSAASAIAGVGNQYAGNVTSQNTAAANAAANAALMAGQGKANMWGSIGGFGGQLGGALFQYGMGQQYPRAGTPPIYGGGGGINVTPNYPIPWGFG